MDALPIWAVFTTTLLLVVAAIEAGYRLGRAARSRSEHVKESPVSAIAATILALLAFIMAFTFGIVSDRYDARKALVREEANAVRTAWSRADFLPEPDRGEAAVVLRGLRGHVGDRLPPDALGGDLLHVAEPDVGVEPPLPRLLPQLADPCRPRVVGREGEQALVELVHGLVLVVLVDHEAHVLHAGVDVGLDLRMSPTFSSLPVAGMTCMTPTAPTRLFTFWSSPDSW